MFPAMTAYYSVSHLGHLSAKEVHELYKLRVDTLVSRANDAHAEIDDADLSPHTMHIMAREGAALTGCARMAPRPWADFCAAHSLAPNADDIAEDTTVVEWGHLAIDHQHHDGDLREQLLTQALEMARGQFRGHAIVSIVDAKNRDFYEEHGFVAASGTAADATGRRVVMIHPAL